MNQAIDVLPVLPADELKARKTLDDFEKFLLSFPDEDKVDCPLEHFFVDGLYIRRLTIPKDTVLVGHIRKDEGYDFMTEGDISVVTKDGHKRLTGFHCAKTEVGLKRVGYAHEKTVWVTVHSNPDNERNIEILEDRMIAASYDEVQLNAHEQAQIKDILGAL